MNDNKWDLIVAGGGLAGVSAAISSARRGCKVLIIEKNSFLGGSATAGLVTPMMKNLDKTGNGLSNGLCTEILDKLRETGNAATHSDGNPGWFNPEMMKCVLDDMCEQLDIDVLYETTVMTTIKEGNKLSAVECINKTGIQKFESLFFIDGTGDADMAVQAGVPFELDNIQALSLRFIMGNVNLHSFAQWIQDIDPDSGLSSVDYTNYETLLLTTAHTWEDEGWKLRPYFSLGIRDGVIQPCDAEYFQVFSIPGQKNSVAFNCPRIHSISTLNPLNQWDASFAYKQGRKQIRRLADFCRLYLKGFEEAYITQIAPQLGIRSSRRIAGEYRLTEKDVLTGKKFEIPVAKSTYPVDIHGQKRQDSTLKKISNGDYYEIPLESLKPKNISNLLVVGRSISSDHKAQGSVRIQPNCWAMGEFAGNYCADKLIELK